MNARNKTLTAKDNPERAIGNLIHPAFLKRMATSGKRIPVIGKGTMMKKYISFKKSLYSPAADMNHMIGHKKRAGT